MNVFFTFFTLFCLFISTYAVGNVRFVNAIEGVSVEIQTDQFATINLAYTGVSSYETANTGSVQITNIIDSTSGDSLINNQPQMIYFDSFYATVALVNSNTGVVCVLYNETLTADQLANGSQTSAFVRFIDLAQLNFTNLQGDGNPNSAILFSYEGYLVNTPFVEVSPQFTSLIVSQAGTSNQWTVPVSLSISSLYTIFFFGESGTYSGVATYDRTIPNGVATTGMSNIPSTTGANVVQTTGMVPSQTSGMQTPVTTASPIINNQQNSASTSFVAVSVILAAVAIAF